MTTSLNFKYDYRSIDLPGDFVELSLTGIVSHPITNVELPVQSSIKVRKNCSEDERMQGYATMVAGIAASIDPNDPYFQTTATRSSTPIDQSRVNTTPPQAPNRINIVSVVAFISFALLVQTIYKICSATNKN